MKRIWLLLLALLLCGCTAAPNTTTQPPAERILTARSWDEEGILTELVLTIPGGNTYTDCMGFRDKLLLWSTDGHQAGQCILELCLIDPAAGVITAAREVTMPHDTVPQVYGDCLYLCDPVTGTVLELNTMLEATGEWTVPAAGAADAVWYAANRKLWEFSREQPLRCLTLSDMYWAEDEEMSWARVRLPRDNVYGHRLAGGIVSFSCLRGEAETFYALDLNDGTVITPPQGYDSYDRSGNVWLGVRYDGDHTYGICVGNGAMRSITPIDGVLSLLPEGYLLERSPGDQYLRLYDREGRCISVCCLWEELDGYAEKLIWSDSLGGYVIHYRPQSGGSRLLFWDIRKGTQGQDLQVQPIAAQ